MSKVEEAARKLADAERLEQAAVTLQWRWLSEKEEWETASRPLKWSLLTSSPTQCQGPKLSTWAWWWRRTRERYVKRRRQQNSHQQIAQAG